MTATLAQRMPLNITPIEPITLVWIAFAISVTASMVPMLVGGISGPIAPVLAVIGSGGCGWLWLMARCLFRTENPLPRWSLGALATIIAVEGMSSVFAPFPTTGPYAELFRVLGNAESFICIGAIAMVFAETFWCYSSDLTGAERTFRLTFAAALGLMVTVTLLWVLNAGENTLGGQWKEPILLSTAVLSIMGTRLCILFRWHNPLSSPQKRKHATKHADDSLLAQRIRATLDQDKAFTTPDLKIADLAATLGEHDYKLTQCITGALGYRNFNHMINSYRINAAKDALISEEHEGQPILSVAYECGFNSIGPFNRAFKQEVGMTPREYRAAHG